VPFWELPGGRHGPGACAPSPVRLGRRRGERRARLSCEICRCAYQHLQQRARNLDFGAAWKKLGPDRSLFPLADLASRPGNLFAPCAAAPAPARVHARCATPAPKYRRHRRRRHLCRRKELLCPKHAKSSEMDSRQGGAPESESRLGRTPLPSCSISGEGRPPEPGCHLGFRSVQKQNIRSKFSPATRWKVGPNLFPHVFCQKRDEIPLAQWAENGLKAGDRAAQLP
jgi:hypothetical protein